MEAFARSLFSSMRDSVSRRKRKDTTAGAKLKNAMLSGDAPFVLRIACSRLSGSGEDTKVKGTRKVGGAEKKEKGEYVGA